MPSRPSLTPPKPPEGAKPVKVRKLSQVPLTMQSPPHRSKEWLLTILFLVLCVLIAVTILIAKTGMYKIPIFSAFYSERPVTRTVVGESVTMEDLSRRMAMSATVSTSTLSIVVTENELTGMAMRLLKATASSSKIYFDQFQVVIMEDGLEAVARIRTESLSARVLSVVKPVVRDGRVSFDLEDTYLGGLPLPSFLADPIMKKLLESNIDSLKFEFNGLKLSGAILHEGSVNLIFEKK